jgi:hypothetical protein
VRTDKLRRQRLKPHSFCEVYVVAKATTHKDSVVLTQTLKPLFFRLLNVAAEAATYKNHLGDSFCTSNTPLVGAPAEWLLDVALRPERIVDSRRLFLLQRGQVVTEICDAFLNDGLVVVIHVLENAAPGGHVRRAVSGDARPEAQDVGDQVVGEFAAMAFAERGEIGGGNFQGGACGAMTPGVQAVAGGAILFEHDFSGGNEVGGKLVLRAGRLGLRAGTECKDQRRCDEKWVAHGKPPIVIRIPHGNRGFKFENSDLKTWELRLQNW